MITFNDIGGYGRLGNQLFQYSILKAISLKRGYDIVLPSNTFDKSWHGQKCKLNNFSLPSCEFRDVNFKHTFNESHNKNRTFLPSVFDVEDDTNLKGFFQNINYYKDIREVLLKEFELLSKYEDFAKEYLNKFSNTTVSLHVRRGDVTDGTNRDRNWLNTYDNNSKLKKYHDYVFSQIPQDSTILLFTGGSRHKDDYSDDLQWCKNNIKDERIIFVNDVDDMETFSIIKNVDINITSFDSTFSWWASYLNQNNNVFAPSSFDGVGNIKNEDIYPDYWKIV